MTNEISPAAPVAVIATNPIPAAVVATVAPAAIQSPVPASSATPPPAAPTPPEASPSQGQIPSAQTPPVDTSKPVAETEKKSTSLLGAEPPIEAKDIPKVAEAAAEVKKEEGSQSAEPAPLPTFEAFKLPDGYTADTAKLGEFTKELADLEVATKADHAQLQAFGQKLVDKHVAEIQRLNDFYKTSWENQKNDWKTSFEKDPEIGGNRADTTLNAARQFLSTHGGSAAQQTELRQLMDSTGVGNHPALIRLLAKANSVLSEGKPLPGMKPIEAPKSKVARRYGSMN